MFRNRLSLMALHGVGVCTFICFPLIFSPNVPSFAPLLHNFMVQREMLSNIFIVIYFYINYYYFIPRLYLARRYVIFGAITLFFLLVSVLVPYLLIAQGQVFEVAASPAPTDMHAPPPASMLFETRYAVFAFLIVGFFSLVVALQSQWHRTEKAKTIAELGYLKAQINPHFLFNTLNSIYALALTKSNDTPDAIVQLSSLMRYATGVADQDTVPVQREIAYIEDYIALQKLRLTAVTQLSVHITGGSETLRISPFLLIPFVENAFKYGVNPEEAAEIVIAIACSSEALRLQVRNSKVHLSPKDDVYSGVGLRNTQHRLAMLYPSRHTLHISETAQWFEVTLLIQFT